METMNGFNKYFLCNFNDITKVEDIPYIPLRHTWQCRWTIEYLEIVIENYVNGSFRKESEAASLDELCHTVNLILIFMQYNFTGPLTELQIIRDLLKRKLPPHFNASHYLMASGEEINSNVELGELLVVAKEMLHNLLQRHPDSCVLHWWHQRLICIHQNVLDCLTSDLYEELKLESEWLLQHVDEISDKEYKALLYLELADGYLLFHRTQKSEQLLQEVCNCLNVTLDVKGLLGLRTKFQQKALPQLCLKVNQGIRNDLPSAESSNGKTDIPKLLLLNDDTRLERILFIDPNDNEVMSLPSVLQALILAKVKQLKRAQPKDKLADEELEPYIQTLLYQEHGPLPVRQSVLLLNCSQESDSRRTIERSWKQCEEIAKLITDTKYSLAERLSYAFVSILQPKWQVHMQLCELLRSLGMTKSALDIYLKLQAWEQVIDCYTCLELRHKAAEVIRQELSKKPTVILHCLLGDATDDPKCYEAAWDLSKHSSGRAQAHWGSYFFRRKEYKEAIPHLERSVQINPLQENAWLRLGYAAISLERWELAVHAYITYTHLEPMGFESWNNLAKALIKLGDKKRAHKILSESLKCNFTNWRVWENYMLVSVDTGNFEDAIHAYERLSELKDRFIDLEVLCVVTKAIIENIPDANGQDSERLRKRVTTFLAHQCVKFANEPKLWELAASIAKTPLNKAQKLIKAYRAYVSRDIGWTLNQADCLKVLQICHEICILSLDAIVNHEEAEKLCITSQLSSARLVAQACIRAIEKDGGKWEENQHLLRLVKKKFEDLSEQLKNRTS